MEYKEDIKDIRDHIRVLNSEMGGVQEIHRTMGTNIEWLKENAQEEKKERRIDREKQNKDFRVIIKLIITGLIGFILMLIPIIITLIITFL